MYVAASSSSLYNTYIYIYTHIFKQHIVKEYRKYLANFFLSFFSICLFVNGICMKIIIIFLSLSHLFINKWMNSFLVFFNKNNINERKFVSLFFLDY